MSNMTSGIVLWCHKEITMVRWTAQSETVWKISSGCQLLRTMTRQRGLEGPDCRQINLEGVDGTSVLWSFIISFNDLCCTVLRAPQVSSSCFSNTESESLGYKESPASVWNGHGDEKPQQVAKERWGQKPGLLGTHFRAYFWWSLACFLGMPLYNQEEINSLVCRSQWQTLPSGHRCLSSKQPALAKHYALKSVWSLPRVNRKFWILSHGKWFLKCFPCPQNKRGVHYLALFQKTDERAEESCLKMSH